MDYSYIDKNLEELKNEIKACALSCGREESDILLMPAVKYATAEEIDHLRTLGVTDIGENRVQQLLEHWERIDADKFNIHFIGSLQTNKVKYIIDKVCLIHSLDSDRLAAEIDKQAGKHGIVMNVLVEINSGNEESKGGVSPDKAEEFALGLEKYKNIRLCGFMTMAPRCEDREEYHGYFSKTFKICRSVWYDRLQREDSPIISMGMSGSFPEAIAEGSTLIRVGSRIFKQ